MFRKTSVWKCTGALMAMLFLSPTPLMAHHSLVSFFDFESLEEFEELLFSSLFLEAPSVEAFDSFASEECLALSSLERL